MWQYLSLVSLVLFVQIQLNLSQPTCSDGSRPRCPGGGALSSGHPPCSGGKPVCADGQEATPPSGGGTPQLGGGTPSRGAPQSSSPHAAPMLGDVAFTTATGTIQRTSKKLAVGENIYGPFEAGFGSQQDFILARLGCSPASLGYVQGGIDTQTAEQMIASQCGTTLPRIQSNAYISLMDECGGHTSEYHFHERMSCLYNGRADGHSTQIGRLPNGQLIYGKWEETRVLPLLDACGGHLGRTPDSPSVNLYHYHVQRAPPFTVGCLGPNDDGSLVTVQQCRDFYSGCDGNFVSITTPARGRYEYDLWCPCFDAQGLNTGVRIAELAVFASSTPTPSPAPTPYPTAPSPAPTPYPTVPRAPTIPVTGRMTMDFPNGTALCSITFKNALKSSVAAAVTAATQAQHTTADVTSLFVGDCRSRLRRLTAGVDVRYTIRVANQAAVDALKSVQSSSPATLTNAFASTLKSEARVEVSGISVHNFVTVSATPAPTSSTVSATPVTTSSKAADTLNYTGQRHFTVVILLAWWWLFFEQR